MSRNCRHIPEAAQVRCWFRAGFVALQSGFAGVVVVLCGGWGPFDRSALRCATTVPVKRPEGAFGLGGGVVVVGVWGAGDLAVASSPLWLFGGEVVPVAPFGSRVSIT
jgi:hypothetical protein